jgi:hypothetical protein
MTDNAENTQKWIIEELTSNIYNNNNDRNNTSISETSASLILTSESSNSLWEHFDSKLSQVRSIIHLDISAAVLNRGSASRY